MRKTLWQVYAIARTEFRFGVRRGLPIVGVGMISGMVSLVVFWQIISGVPTAFPEVVLSSSLARAWTVFVMLTSILLPMIGILVIPADREFKIGSWLHSLPVDGAIYLAGKLLGILTITLAIWGICLALHMLVYWVWIGSFNLRADLDLILIGGLPLVLWSIGVGVLLGAWLRSRRAALLVGVLAGFASLYAWGYLLPLFTSTTPYFAPGTTYGPSAFISRNTLADYALSRLGLLPNYLQPVSSHEALMTFLVAYAFLLLLAVSARLWIFARENV